MSSMSDETMNVIKRDGSIEPVSFDKVLERIRKAAAGLSVNYTRLAQLVLAEIHDGVHTTELDELAARLAISYMTLHPDWASLAAQIIISNCQRSAPASFSEAMTLVGSGLAPAIATFIQENAAALNEMIRPTNDFLLDYFGFKTLEKAYLMRGKDRRILETPQYMWLRVSVGIWALLPDPALSLTRIQETYTLMSTKAFTHATPTLFNAGTPRPQLSSCFLLAMKADSIDGIFDTLKDCANISKYAGGIGLHVHNIRAQGTPIAGTQGTSNGLVPMLRVFNNTARYVDQGGGKRNGSFAIYLEPWHADIQSFLKMKSNTGSEEERARDLFYGLWIPDLFMKRVETDGQWSLFCPHEAPGLADVVGSAFEELYIRYEAEGRAKRIIPAQKLWSEVLVSQIETGTPYLLYKDAANAKSNQKNLGTIKSSNLCVAPETIIRVYDEWRGVPAGITQDVPIHTLEGKEVTVWNGTGFSKVVIRKTGEQQPLLRIQIEQTIVSKNGQVRTEPSSIDCTLYHKFLIQDSGSFKERKRMAAYELYTGVELASWKTEDGTVIHQRVLFVDDNGRQADTYCYNEPENNVAIFNGILTGNCTEIIEFSSPEETAVCNLASIALPYFLLPNKSFDFARLREVTAIIVRNLNRVIDINYYPTPETERSNFRHRPIGIGVQGLADVFASLGLPWETLQAAALNQEIFENIYYAAVQASSALAETDGTYSSFMGSPASEGVLQPDLWESFCVQPSATTEAISYKTNSYLDWTALRNQVKTHGLSNSLLLAPMPTASTSQILGYNECIEPFTTNIYVRRTLAGEFTVINRYLVADLMAVGLWSPEIKERIVAANGSVQGLDIPKDLKDRYKTVWEIKQKTLIDMAADRGAFICQSQSLNLFIQDPTIAKLSSMHFYAWKRGLKTGIYYLRTKSAVQAIKFTVDASAPAPAPAKAPEECLLCSS